jgi:hypothetical protein
MSTRIAFERKLMLAKLMSAAMSAICGVRDHRNGDP